MILKSSNTHKIKEFQRLLIGKNIIIQKGEDIKEVLGNKDEVIIYKTLAAGNNVLVEDSVLIIDGKEEVEIRWKWKNLKTNSLIKIIISIGLLKNNKVYVYRGELEAIVDRSKGMNGVAFEPFIIPLEHNPNKLTFTELMKVINKDLFDPRAKAVKNLLNNNPAFIIDVKDIPTWNGKYQNS